MKSLLNKSLAIFAGALTLAATCGAQTVTNPVPNQIISWNLDNNSTINPADLAGLAPATHWVDTYLNNVTTGLPDNSGAATTLNLAYGSFNTAAIHGSHPGYDANGTANREMLNGYLNAGPAAWDPPTTNSFVSITNVPYAQYDVVVYFSSDTSGRHSGISDGTTTYYFSTVGSPETSGANALFLPTTQTDSTQFPSADFAFFPGKTNVGASFTTYPKSGNDQWLGIAAIQVIQSSNVYVLYGPSPATQTISQGQSASFSVMAGGLNPAYQWRHAGTNIVNATNATYAIASTVAGQDGNYDVVVTNSFSSITGAVAALTFYAPKTDTWAGTGSTWDFSSLNWTVNGGVSATNYADTDNVRFDPLGAAQSTVSLGGTVSPTSITVSNASYTFISGSFAGSGSLHLMNNATFILDTVDTRTGSTLIDNGSALRLDNGDSAGSLGSGALTNNGTLIFNAAGDEAYGYPVYGTGSITNLGASGQITLGNNINANYLVQAGGGTLLLQGNNSLTGGLVVDSGTVLARVSGSLGSGAVLLNGGELQLIFVNDFTGSAMTLAGGLLHGGIGGNNSFDGKVSLATNSTIQVDGVFTLNSAAGLKGGGFNLTTIGSGTLILPGTNNSWASVTINAGTLQIGNGADGSLGGGTITNSSVLTFDIAGNLVVTNPITGGGAINQNGAGTVTLTADNSGAGFTGNINVTNGTLLINVTSGYGVITVNTNATLGGNGFFDAEVDVNPGGTLAPGTVGSVATLTMNNNLSIGGNVLMKLNKSLPQSNDVVTVANGFVYNAGGGSVSVENLGPALAIGDKFTLFSQPVTSGDTLTVTGGGAVWTNNLAVDGSIRVLSTTVPHPVITGVVTAAGTNLVFRGNNGLATGTYHVLSSTNLTQTNWTVEASGSFDGSGNFSVTNTITPGNPQKFYRLQVP
jgi:autotransporter-associated beta strand protein